MNIEMIGAQGVMQRQRDSHCVSNAKSAQICRASSAKGSDTHGTGVPASSATLATPFEPLGVRCLANRSAPFAEKLLASGDGTGTADAGAIAGW